MEQTHNEMLHDIARILYTQEEIQARVTELGAEISRDYAGLNPVLIGVLRGVFMFMADLARAITIPINIDFIGITRYGPSTRTQGVVRFTKDLDINISGRHVLFVEDVIDTGLSLRYILRALKAREPASLKVCTLLNKSRSRLFSIEADYIGFDGLDQFVVGYGLDYDEQYRHLPFIGVLKEEAITHQRLPPGAQTE